MMETTKMHEYFLWFEMLIDPCFLKENLLKEIVRFG